MLLLQDLLRAYLGPWDLLRGHLVSKCLLRAYLGALGYCECQTDCHLQTVTAKKSEG